MPLEAIVSLELAILIISLVLITIAVAVWLTRIMDRRCHEQITEIKALVSHELLEIKRDNTYRRTQAQKDQIALHERINAVKDTYVRISDHDKDVSRLQAAVSDTRLEVRLDHDKIVDLAMYSSPKVPHKMVSHDHT